MSYCLQKIKAALAKCLLVVFVVFGIAASPRLSAQADVWFTLDPTDHISYREWAKNEYKVAIHDGDNYVAQLFQGFGLHPSEVPSTSVNPLLWTNTGEAFWTGVVPRWVKSFAINPFKPKPTNATDRDLTWFWQGLEAYQRTRATLKAMVLIKASLSGLRFEVDAWKLLANVVAYGDADYYATTDDAGQTIPITIPRGVVGLSIVPKGKENWRDIVKLFADDPVWDENRARVQFNGPRSLSDITIVATESYTDPLFGTRNNEIGQFLEAADRQARAASEGIMAVNMFVKGRVDEARRMAMSPHKLAAEIRKLQRRRQAAYESIYLLRSILENRTPSAIAAEYADVADLYIKDAKNALAQAEASSTFYQQLQAQATNAVAPLIAAPRLEEIAKLEKDWQRMFNDQRSAKDMKDLKDLWANADYEHWSMLMKEQGWSLPYTDLGLVIEMGFTLAKGADYDKDSENDPSSDIHGYMKHYRAKVFAVRFGYHLWEELKVARQIYWIDEQVKLAAVGVTDDVSASLAYKGAIALAHERQMAVVKMQNANTNFAAHVAAAGTTP